MHLKKNKNLFIFALLLAPLTIGIISCSSNKKSSNKISEEITSELIPPITAVAALGQLSPSGEIRKLAAPISQFGSSPRIIEILVNEGDFVKKGDILAIFENREKLVADLEQNKNLIKIINDEIALKKDQIERYEIALNKDAYSFVQLSQRKDELLKLQKQKIIQSGNKKTLEMILLIQNSEAQLMALYLGLILELERGLIMKGS